MVYNLHRKPRGKNPATTEHTMSNFVARLIATALFVFFLGVIPAQAQDIAKADEKADELALVAHAMGELGIGEAAARVVVSFLLLKGEHKDDMRLAGMVEQLIIGIMMVDKARADLETLVASLPTGDKGSMVPKEVDTAMRIAASIASEGGRTISSASLALSTYRIDEFLAKCGNDGKRSIKDCLDETERTVVLLGAAQKMMVAAANVAVTSARIQVARGFKN